MRTKGAALGTASNWAFNFMVALTLIRLSWIFAGSEGLTLVYSGCRNYTHWYPNPSLEVLHYLDRFQRIFCTHRLPFLPRNRRPFA